MSLIQPVKCDICKKHGALSHGWVSLTDFAYVKHACPDCAEKADGMMGRIGSYHRDLKLCEMVRCNQFRGETSNV